MLPLLLLAAPAVVASALAPAWPPAGVAQPLLFGPLAHHPANGQKEHAANETLALLAGELDVRERIVASRGALHISIYNWGPERV
jgi:hypothetical protein